MFKARNKAWFTARRSGKENHWLTFRQLRNKCTSAVRKAKSEYYLSLITSSRNPQNLWKIVNSLKNNSLPFPTSISANNQLISDQKEICQIFNSHFATAGHIFDRNNTNILNKTDPNSIVSKSHGFFSIQPFSPYLIANALAKINPRKVTGEDGLDPILLRLAPVILEYILYIFNLSVLSCRIPRVWKIAHVIHFHKGGETTELNNYRPISK